MAKFKAIKGKKLKLPTRVMPQARVILTDFQRKGVDRASKYPAQLPPKPRHSADKRRKPRPYRRTGSLLKSWSRSSGVTGRGKSISARIVSSPALAPYNVLVVGPKTGAKGERQTKEMQRRNWPSAPALLEDLWESDARPRLERLLTNQS